MFPCAVHRETRRESTGVLGGRGGHRRGCWQHCTATQGQDADWGFEPHLGSEHWQKRRRGGGRQAPLPHPWRSVSLHACWQAPALRATALGRCGILRHASAPRVQVGGEGGGLELQMPPTPSHPRLSPLTTNQRYPTVNCKRRIRASASVSLWSPKGPHPHSSRGPRDNPVGGIPFRVQRLSSFDQGPAHRPQAHRPQHR